MTGPGSIRSAPLRRKKASLCSRTMSESEPEKYVNRYQINQHFPWVTIDLLKEWRECQRVLCRKYQSSLVYLWSDIRRVCLEVSVPGQVYLSMKEVLERYIVNQQAVYTWARSKKIRSIQHGSDIRYCLDDLETLRLGPNAKVARQLMLRSAQGLEVDLVDMPDAPAPAPAPVRKRVGYWCIVNVSEWTSNQRNTFIAQDTAAFHPMIASADVHGDVVDDPDNMSQLSVLLGLLQDDSIGEIVFIDAPDEMFFEPVSWSWIELAAKAHSIRLLFLPDLLGPTGDVQVEDEPDQTALSQPPYSGQAPLLSDHASAGYVSSAEARRQGLKITHHTLTHWRLSDQVRWCLGRRRGDDRHTKYLYHLDDLRSRASSSSSSPASSSSPPTPSAPAIPVTSRTPVPRAPPTASRALRNKFEFTDCYTYRHANIPPPPFNRHSLLPAPSPWTLPSVRFPQNKKICHFEYGSFHRNFSEPVDA